MFTRQSFGGKKKVSCWCCYHILGRKRETERGRLCLIFYSIETVPPNERLGRLAGDNSNNTPQQIGGEIFCQYVKNVRICSVFRSLKWKNWMVWLGYELLIWRQNSTCLKCIVDISCVRMWHVLKNISVVFFVLKCCSC